MADISKQIEDFRNAIYGEDVRGSMIEAFKAINDSTEGLADEAKASEHAAKASETNAKTSEQAAKASETNAKTSEQAAKASETNAKTSEQAAATSETNAKTSETNAEEYAREAEESAKNAREMVGIGNFTGATDEADGSFGFVPTPTTADKNRVLQGNGGWGHVLTVDIVYQNGQYGYIGERGAFVPFKSQADINAAVSAAKVGTATSEHVLSGKTFTNAESSGLTGTMVNQGKKTYTINPGAQQTIPKGYHDGTGFVKANPNQNADTYAFPSGDTGAKKDMGANNVYRYVDASEVYKKGKADVKPVGTFKLQVVYGDFGDPDKWSFLSYPQGNSGLYQVEIQTIV